MKCCWHCIHCIEDPFTIECHCALEKAEWHEEDDEGLVCVDFVDEDDDFPSEEVADYDV